MFKCAQIEGPVGTLARSSQNAITDTHCLTRREGPQGSAADPEGFCPLRRGREEERHGGDQPKKAIWTYVYACLSAGGDLELLLCMFERRKEVEGNMDLRLCTAEPRQRFGIVFVHV